MKDRKVIQEFYHGEKPSVLYAEINGKRNGEYFSWHDNGILEKRCFYKNGKVEGLYESWYANGQKCITARFKNDMLNGLSEWVFSSGVVKRKRFMKNDLGFGWNWNIEN